MKRVLLFSVLIPGMMLWISSCKTGGKTGLLVPSDAAFVVHLNNTSISSKLSWQEISQTNWFRELSKEVTDTMSQKLFDDPAASGVDYKADIVFFVKKQGRGSILVINGSLNDATAYESYAKKLGEGAPVMKDGDFSFVSIGQKGVLGWNKTHFIYVIDAPMPDMQSALQRRDSSIYEPFKFTPDSLKYFGKNILSLKNSDRLDNDSRFTALVKDGSDMHLWTNSGEYYKNMMGPMLSMMRANVLLEGNVQATSLNFENGKISLKSKQFFGREMTSFMSKYKPRSVSADMFTHIPSENVIGVLAFNYPPEGLNELLKLTGTDGLANMFLMQAGFSMDELIKAFKGEILLTVTDLEVKDKKDSIKLSDGKPLISNKTPAAKILFAASVNDKASFQKLINVLEDQMKRVPAASRDKITFKLDDKWFVAGNSAEQFDKFLSGPSTKHVFADKISGHPFGLYIDIQKILKVASSDVKDSSDILAIEKSLNTWQDIVVTGGEFKNKAMEYSAEINMVDKNTNSLKQLNSYLDIVAPFFKEHRKKIKNTDFFAPRTDSTGIIPERAPALRD